MQGLVLAKEKRVVRKPPRHHPLTLAVMSGKGGAGKSSISANLAASLATAGRRVLLVDADLGLANLHIMLGLKPKATVADVLDGRLNIRDVLLPGPAGVKLLPATSGMHRLTQLDDGQRATLFAAIESVEADFDVAILDCPAGIGDDVQLFGRIADEVLVVATPEPTSLADAYALMKVLHSEGKRATYRLVASLVRNDRQARSVYRVLSKVTDQHLSLQIDFFGSVPSDDKWRRAILDGELAYTRNPSSAASRHIDDIAARVRCLERTARSDRTGLGALLLGEPA